MYVTPDREHIALAWRQDLANLIPHAREFSLQGQRLLLVPNNHDEAKVARNLGVPVPAPILTRYSFPHHPGKPPWAIQRTTAALLTESARAYVLSTMGTGKTYAALWAADYLRQSTGIKHVLIAACLSTLTPVWETALFELFPRAKVKVLHGTRLKRRELLAQEATFYVINHHGLAVIEEELVAKNFGIVIIDELSSRGLRTKGTGLWKSANAIVNSPSVQYAWGLTGTPTPRAPIDAWAQVRLLTPLRTTKTLTRFKDLTMRQVSQFKWVPRPEATAIVHEAMQPSVRYALEDVMELPPTSYINREVKLDHETAKAYKLLFDKMYLQTNKGQGVTALNEGILFNKLLQTACGYLYTDKGQVYALPNKNRLTALLELIQEAEKKVIVFVPYVHALHGVVDYLRKQDEDVALVYGNTSRTNRDKIFKAFQEDSSPRVLVAHPECMSHGLTLTSANVIIWYAPVPALDIYEQANARIVRPSQTSKTLIAHLVGTPVERVCYYRLKERQKLQGLLLELFHQQELDY